MLGLGPEDDMELTTYCNAAEILPDQPDHHTEDGAGRHANRSTHPIRMVGCVFHLSFYKHFVHE